LSAAAQSPWDVVDTTPSGPTPTTPTPPAASGATPTPPAATGESEWDIVKSEKPKSEETSAGNSLLELAKAPVEFAKGAWQEVNPVTLAQGVATAAQHPIATLENLGAQQGALLDKARASYDQGDYLSAARHAAMYLVPVVGPHMDMMGDLAQSGHLAQAMGQATAFGVTSALGARGSIASPAAPIRIASAPAETLTPAETAEQVARVSTPETALENMIKARNLEATKQAYNAASPAMRQTMQQQHIMQLMKEAGGDASTFGQLINDAKDAIPLADHQVWEGAKRAAQYQQLLDKVNRASGTPLALAELGAHFIPGGHVITKVLAGSKIISRLMGTGAGRNVLSRLGAMPVNSPAFRSLWNTVSAAELNRNIAASQPTPSPYAAGGPIMDRDRRRLRRNTLRSLGYAAGGAADDDTIDLGDLSDLVNRSRDANAAVVVPPRPQPAPPPKFQDPVAAALGRSAGQMSSGWEKLTAPSDTTAADPAWWNQKAQGASDVLRGSAPFLAPLAIPAAAAAPVATGFGLLGGTAGAAGVEALAQKAGVPAGQAALAGDISGLAGGILAPHVAPDLISGTVEGANTIRDLINQLDYTGTNPERGSISPRVTNPAGVNVRGTMSGAKGKIYVPLPEDVTALATKLQPDNPDAAMREAAATLKWRNWDKPAAEEEFGPLVRSAAADPKLARLQNTPERVGQRIQAAQSFLAQPTEPWTPTDYGIFDRSLIKQAMGGFPDVEQTAFPRTQPTRADVSYIDEIYNDPTNRALIKQQIARGLPLGGQTFYPSLYPVKAEAIARGLTSDAFPQTGGDLFDNWIHSVAPGSARNSIYNERAVGNFLRNMNARGIPLTPENIATEIQGFQGRYGMKLPLMPVHAAGAARVLEQGISPVDVLHGNLTDSYKIPTYSAQQTGNFAHSWTGDVHEAKGETLGSPYHPYFTQQGGFGVNEYGRAEQNMRAIAGEMGLPTGTAQAGRWFGGGELTGLRSPRGDSLDLLERQVAYTLHAQGQPTDPLSVRNYTMKLIQQGGDLLPWYKDDPMPDYRRLR
jgi:hypothetical protein